jgi:peptidoglycan-associated lipoprotein
MKITTLGPLTLLAALALLAGCDSPSKLNAGGPVVPVETRTPVPASSVNAATATATPQSSVATVDLGRSGNGNANGAAAAAALTQRIVYFDFDSFVIKDDFKGLIEAHAKVLAASQGRRMVVEGHTDERGGREYNLALGQKRAEAVVHALELLGAADKQLEAVSFGKERPAVQGNDEAAWARNRRAELKDR